MLSPISEYLAKLRTLNMDLSKAQLLMAIEAYPGFTWSHYTHLLGFNVRTSLAGLLGLKLVELEDPLARHRSYRLTGYGQEILAGLNEAYIISLADLVIDVPASQEVKYILALLLVNEVSARIEAGTVHFRASNGHLIETLEDFIHSALEGDLRIDHD